MTTVSSEAEENKALVRRFLEELVKGNFDIIDELVALALPPATPDLSFHAVLGGQILAYGLPDRFSHVTQEPLQGLLGGGRRGLQDHLIVGGDDDVDPRHWIVQQLTQGQI
jgi:hypothetical protein